MKCVIAFSCLLAVASAGYLNSAVAYGASDDGSYKGEFYNGAPSGVYGGAYTGSLGYASHGSYAVAYNSPIVSVAHGTGHSHAGSYSHGYAQAHGYAQGAPIAINHGSRAVAYNAPLVSAPHPVHVAYSGPLAHAYAANTGPVVHGVAPIAHGYAHGYAHATPVAHGFAHGLASEARLIDPVAIAAGAPLPTGDTVEVAAAKAFHHQAHVEAKNVHLASKGHFLVKRGLLNAGFAGYAAPLAYAAAPAHGYAQTYGVSAYASPLAYSGYSGYGHGGHIGAYYG